MRSERSTAPRRRSVRQGIATLEPTPPGIHELVDLPVVRQIVLDRSERFTAVDCIVANEVTGRDVLNISLMVGGAAIGVVGLLVGGPEVGAAVLAASASLALGATATVLAYLDYKTLERTFHARGLSPSMVDQAAVAAAHTAFRWSAAALVVDGALFHPRPCAIP